ncbi:HelD family protein [Candidatus Epulonipiscium viviparus]|uniref:HelD family protein n=1 Tax=Candidatus Epulonipiscium viviparus TaxID=420336 RepID=UPI00273806AD|nr:UvrD-helicase domain-containing protein [Candidatus Epulopiscium viviparus]
MDSLILIEEETYLQYVLNFLDTEISFITNLLTENKETLLEIRKEMWEEGMTSLEEEERSIEIGQYLNTEMVETSKYKHKTANLLKYEKMRDSPYFGRVDFLEDGEYDPEKVYIGYHNLMNDDTLEMLVYDWRAPISSIFYNGDLGRISYQAPVGQISGKTLLKRQYKVEHRKLKYFFDSETAITDSVLQIALSSNVSEKMKNIVQTIQKEQNDIIRNMENDLLIVQGVAGSGKTSIAMHRIAYLLYNQRDSGFNENNILIISPNSLFGEYISGVLPELGEKNVRSHTVEELFHKEFGSGLQMESKHRQLELMISSTKNRDKLREEINFKGSFEFIKILDRFLAWYEEKGAPLPDIIYEGNLIMESAEFVAHILDNQINVPLGRRLNRVFTMVKDRIKPFEQIKLTEIAEQLIEEGGFDYEEEAESRRRIDVIREQFFNQISAFMKNNYLEIYKMFLQKFHEFVRKERLPQNIAHILSKTRNRIENSQISYMDGSILLYMRLILDGTKNYATLKQIVIDEAQDYYPIHFKIFSLMFKKKRYTILGDFGQTIEKTATAAIYDDALKILKPKNPTQIALTKSYRSSYEINAFISKIRGEDEPNLAFMRNERDVEIFGATTTADLNELLIKRVEQYRHEFNKIAIICKDKNSVLALQETVGKKLNAQFITKDDILLKNHVLVMPTYMVKGLEYDAVVIYDASVQNYQSIFDKQLLYIACSRALHRLDVLYLGKLTKFIH